MGTVRTVMRGQQARLMVESMTDESSSPLADELPRIVGSAAMAAALAEWALHRLLAGLLDSKYTEIVTAGLPMAALIANCTALVKVHTDLDAQQRAKAEDLLSKIKEGNERRNRLAHSVLALDQSGQAEGHPEQITALYTRHQKPGLSENMTVDEARQVAEKLRAAVDELVLWTFSTLPAASKPQVYPPLPKRP